MNIEKMFDPNSYTEKAMPLSTALLGCLKDGIYGGLDMASDAILKAREKRTETFDEVEVALFNKVWDAYCEETLLENEEHFNLGLKLGTMLVLELLGKGGELK